MSKLPIKEFQPPENPSSGEAKQIPVGWARTTLSEFGELFCGQSLPPTKVNRAGSGVPYVTGPEHWDGQKVHLDKWTNEPARMAPDGCIFITVKGAGVGKLFPGVPCAIGRDIYAYRASSEIPRKFVELSLRFTIAQVVAEAKGDIPGLSKIHILDHTIPLPPLAEQRRIVAKIEELFSELDAGEESLRRARRQLGVYRQSLLKQAFEGKLTEPWRKQNPHLLEDPELESVEASNRHADGWRSIKLGSAIENPSYGTSKKCSYESGGVGVLRIPNVVNGSIDAEDLKFAEFTKDEVASYALKAGDLLMIRSNGSVSIVGRCALIESKHTGLLYAGYLIRLRPITSLIDPLFLRAQMTSLKLRSQIEFSAKSTSGVNNINSKEIQRLVIALPPLPEQQEIVRLLDEQFTVIEQNEREIDAALKRSAALRQSILKKAFTGQLVPQDPTDEPAAILLERIRAERETTPSATSRRTKIMK